MRLFHGTAVGLRDTILQEGLRGRGRPTFFAEGEPAARRYARARAAQTHAHGGPAIGLLVVVEVEPDLVEPDPFGREEPGQWRTLVDIPAAAIVEIREVRFGWGLISLEKWHAFDEACQLDRARALKRDVWTPPSQGDVQFGLAQLRALPKARVAQSGASVARR